MVVLFHASALGGAPQWFRGGFLGVSVFFVLSGLLMVRVVLRSADAAPDGRLAVGPYLSRRVGRLVPASAVVTIMAVALARTSWSAWPGLHSADAIAAVTGWMNWQVIHLGADQVLRGLGPLGPFWSLAVEWQFYLVLLVTCRLPWGTMRQRLVVLAAATVTAGTALQFAAGGSSFVREFGTERRLAELGVGVALGALLDRRPDLRLPAGVGPAAAVSVAGLWVFADFDPPWLLHGGFTLVAVVAAILIVSIRPPSGWRTPWTHRTLVGLGRDSYSVYLVHWPVGQLLAAHTSLPAGAFVAVAAGAAWALGATLARLVERPAQRAHVGVSTGLGVIAVGLALLLLP